MILLLSLFAAPADAAFEKHVRPVLAEHCLRCHGPKKKMGGLRLDSRAALLKGGDSGPAVVTGKPEDSLLLKAVRHDGELKMPKGKKLPAPAIEALAAWVKAGAPWPDERPVVDAEAWRKHWAFRPVRRPAVPDAPGGRNPIDRFLLAAQRSKGIAPSPEASREALLRRACFTLTGLPPTPGQRAAFLADKRPGAYERLVDRLLASPAHGEHLARPWLDLARFADTKGYVFFQDAAYPWAWAYRDYVFESFNAGLPYDRFLKEQLAADLLPGAGRRALRALGFVTLGGRFMNNPHDILDDQIDVVTRGLMGLTVSCARCHDHKFDPIPTADYYALYGVFASCEEVPVPPEYGPPPAGPSEREQQYKKFAAELAKRETALSDFLEKKRAALVKSARARAAEYLLAAHARRGQPRADDFMLLADPGDLNPAMINRWQAYLTRAPLRVWAPWHAYAALPRGKFPDAARSVLIPKDANPLVARLFATPPASIAEVAARYGKLLNDVEKAGPRTADERELHAVFHGPDAPPDITPGLFSELELLPDRAAQGELQKFRKPVEQWRATGPGAPPRAHALRDCAKLYDPVVFRRGNPATPGERVQRRFPAFLGGKRFTKGAGRLELAEAIASPSNPLTARVMANRLWLVAFGRGLVDTPGDFGLRAAAPSHPELLDWLADEFVGSGWDVKRVLRLIVTSHAFRQAGGAPPKIDPDNTLLSRFPRRRLSLEQLRDALLVVSDQLDAHVGGPSVKGEMAPGIRRRTLYTHVDRIHVSGLFRSFDFPSPDASSPERAATLVPQQALFLMNGQFALHAARALAARTSPLKGEARVAELYRIVYCREPSPDERKLALAFVRSDADWPGYAHALLLANEFTFLD